MAASSLFCLSPLFISLSLPLLPHFSSLLAHAASCSTSFANNDNLFSNCLDLVSQDASLAWTFFPANSTLSLAYSNAPPSQSGWVGWGINFAGTSMVGTNALIAFQTPNGASVLPYKLTADVYGNPSLPLESSSIDLDVLQSSVQITGTAFIIFATVQLSPSQTSLNHVWNTGPSVSNDIPAPHSLAISSLKGMQTIDMTTGAVTGTGGIPNQKLKNAHGILNAISWGFLLPLGAMAARYLRPFPFADPAWFYIHVSCQMTGYLLGVAGWAIGLRLGHLSAGIVRYSHRNIGIAIFVFGTLQVLALFVRPDKKHRYRKYWNVYHHTVGYMVILLSIINIFKGFALLQPPNGYKVAYIVIIVILGCILLGLEVLTWVYFFRKRKGQQSETQMASRGNTRNGGVSGAPPKWDDTFDIRV